MDSGSMVIKNSFGGTTVLTINKDTAFAKPEDNALNDAKSTLKIKKASPLVMETEIAFLEEFIKKFAPSPSKEDIKNSLHGIEVETKKLEETL